jgi:hypothetical protein
MAQKISKKINKKSRDPFEIQSLENHPNIEKANPSNLKENN